MTINPEGISVATPPPQILNYKNFREDMQEPLGDLWDDSSPLIENFMRIAREAVVIPYADIQLPMLAAYSFIPSAMATVVPLLFIQGDKGSGKSTLTTLIGALHDTQIYSAATTFAALRTWMNKLRWHFPDICEGEKNCCLLFDNINKETLQNEQLYTMLLNGYNRRTDVISISKGNGENMDFKVFGLKIMSSIHPFYINSKFSELARRCLVIKCKPFEQMTAVEKQSSNMPDDFSIVERLELEGLDLSILHKSFTEFWKDTSNLLNYTATKRKLTSRKKSFNIPKVIDGSKWTISVDLIVTGIVIGLWDSIPVALETIGKYWEWYNSNVASAYGATHKILQDFIEQELHAAVEINKEVGYEAVEREINAEKLKKHINWASAQGMLDISPTPTTVAAVMADLGWKLDKGRQNQICWMPTLG